ncbi:FadR/GntR family transcriptional regulator [Sinisalibacter lacisalsi]|uniref:GntR family transcriptional regulator n=1 Tax=Sinisalibacter lacisalsi TaxID=1526570 RepID=A0ABQ1QSF3_9RHOB|nr:FCD domain-containing protein [Sinisalibacter lacisalsi]GGD42064.1 GntR family transcriptional regulator [Sinisalibacter lacisalsi]
MRGNADEIAGELRKRVMAGEWGGEKRLPTEREFATQYGVARNTIRRAFDQLEADGLLARQVGRGTYLRDHQADDEIAEIVRRMEGTSPADMMEVRLLLEPAATAFAATNASSSALAAIAEAHERAVAAKEMPEFEAWDAEFHRKIFSCTRNDLLREFHEVIRILRDQPKWFEMKARSFAEDRRKIYCEEHAKILEALNARHPEQAAAAMRTHLESVQKNLLGRPK